MSDILIIGIGGMGGNVLNHLISASNIPSRSLLYVDTDAQALEHSLVQLKMPIGESSLRGLGTGHDVDKGKVAAENSEEIWCPHANTVFLIAGLGGGTGSGAIQVYARKLLSLGKRVVCIVSTPFQFENRDGRKPSTVAQETIIELERLGVEKIIFNNQDLFKVADEKTTFADAFRTIDKKIAGVITKAIEEEVDAAADEDSDAQNSMPGSLINRLSAASSKIWEDYLFPAIGVALIGCLALGVLLSLYDSLWIILYLILGFSPFIAFILVDVVIRRKYGHYILPKRYEKLSVWVLLLMVIGMFLWIPSQEYLREAYRPFGLNASSTAYDYKTASNSDRGSWSSRVYMHPNLICMTPRARSCGHWVNDDTREKFSNCAINSIDDADSNKTLGDICKECLIRSTFRSSTTEKKCRY